jgi:Zn-finger nucleic acid-binding protein
MKVCVHGHGPLKSIVREGIEIDYCPKCGGVWLDHGELENLLEKASQSAHVQQNMAPQIDLGNKSSASTLKSNRKYDDNYEDDYEDDYQDRGRDSKRRRRKKKDGILDDIFDFDFFG